LCRTLHFQIIESFSIQRWLLVRWILFALENNKTFITGFSAGFQTIAFHS